MDKQKQISKRNEYITNLQRFLTSSKESVHDILLKINWSKESTVFKEHENSFVNCPLNTHHRVPCDKLESHKRVCLWHSQGYKNDSIPLPEASSSSSTSIVIGKELQAKIILEAAAEDPLIKIGNNVRERDVPQTSDRYFSDFTTDERRVLDNYVVQKTIGAVPVLEEFSLPSHTDSRAEPMTKEQLMAAERDAKRRRVRYRAVKVHTKSKNYSEVMREVINNQMQAYENWLKEQQGIAMQPESAESEKQTTVENNSEKKDLIWLNWDFRSNPHIRWKQILEGEKRYAERERYKSCSRVDSDLKKKERDQNSSRKHHKNDGYKCSSDSYGKRKRESHSFDRSRENSYDSGRDYYRSSHDRSYRKNDNSSKRSESRNSKYISDRDERESKYTRHDRESYSESSRKVTDYKSGISKGSSSKHHSTPKDKHIKTNMEFDNTSQSNYNLYFDECQSSKKQKFNSSASCKQEENSSESEIKSAFLGSSKHRKKSQKKHKKKHKKKLKKEKLSDDETNISTSDRDSTD